MGCMPAIQHVTDCGMIIYLFIQFIKQKKS